MRVLLINPFYPLEEMPSPPLGLSYIAGALLDAGCQVEILDLVVEAYDKERLRQLFARFSPQLVGTTSVTMTFDNACDVLRDIRDISPTVTTVMGGPHITFDARQSLELHPELDLAVLGEGEQIIVELISALEKNESLSAIAGIAYRTGEDIHITQSRSSRLAVDHAPEPARHLLPMGRYRTLGLAVTMITSRGCPFQCIFCVGRKMSGSKVRYRDAISVVDEMEALHNYGFHQINIADDLFTAKKKHCYAICEEIIRRGLSIRWTAFSRANTISAELLTMLKKAGCAHLSFGFESASEEILETVQKGINPEQMLTAARLCREAEIPGQASFILGLPGETAETLQLTTTFADRINGMGTAVGFHLLAPFPGTRVREQAEELGIRILSNDWRRYTANEAICDTPGASATELEAIPFEMQRQLDRWFTNIDQNVTDGSASKEELQHIRGLQRMDIFYRMMMEDLLDKVNQTLDPDASPKQHTEQLFTAAIDQLPYANNLVRELLNEATEKKDICYKRELQDSWHWS